MKYEKALADKFCFKNNRSFMTYSGGSDGQALAEQAALHDPIVSQAIKDTPGADHAEISTAEPPKYNALTGTWTITVNICNHGGHIKSVIVVYE